MKNSDSKIRMFSNKNRIYCQQAYNEKKYQKKLLMLRIPEGNLEMPDVIKITEKGKNVYNSKGKVTVQKCFIEYMHM